MIAKRTFKVGEVITRENDAGETAYVIRGGKVEVTKARGDQSVHLAYLGVGDVFGEMSMIDDKPRSATVTAVEPTEVDEIHQDAFFDSLRSDDETARRLLGGIFERLREANNLILQLQSTIPPMASKKTRSAGPTVTLVALTAEARRAFPDGADLIVRKFPYRIGRITDDPLTHNDLAIPDSPPWQVSRHHASIICEGDRIGLMDRGSKLGAEFDGQLVGGPDGKPGPVFMTSQTTTLVLGTGHTPWRFEVRTQ